MADRFDVRQKAGNFHIGWVICASWFILRSAELLRDLSRVRVFSEADLLKATTSHGVAGKETCPLKRSHLYSVCDLESRNLVEVGAVVSLF